MRGYSSDIFLNGIIFKNKQNWVFLTQVSHISINTALQLLSPQYCQVPSNTKTNVAKLGCECKHLPRIEPGTSSMTVKRIHTFLPQCFHSGNYPKREYKQQQNVLFILPDYVKDG